MGRSVTGRIKEITQPTGGYLNPKLLDVTQLISDKELGKENVHPALVGMAVDYLTRFMLTEDARSSFAISLMGANLGNYTEDAERYLSHVKGLDSESVRSALRLSGYDSIYRAGIATYRPVETIQPDTTTIDNIIEMVERSLRFWSLYGPVLSDGFTFEGGYTKTVSIGDGDYLTEDTLWDFKVSSKEPTKNYTLQLLMYWIMGIHSGKGEFAGIRKIGIFNPRLNKVYTYELSKLDRTIITAIEKDIICY